MTPSELMQALADAGAPMEAIVIAVRALEEKDAVLAEQRAVARDRKRRQRAKERDMDGTVTGRSRDNAGTVTDTPPLSRPPNDINSNPPTHTPPDTHPARARANHPLPADWQPKTYATSTETRKVMDAWPPGELKAEVERFAAHHRKKGNEFKDWDAAWTTWALDRRQFNGRPHQEFRGSGGAGPDRRSSLARAIDEGLEFLGE